MRCGSAPISAMAPRAWATARAAGGQELIDGRRAQDGRDDEHVDGQAEQNAEADASEAAQPHGPAVAHDQEVDEVHADHHQVHVGDPHDVEHAEDQVEAEGEEREHAAQQHAVDGRLEQEDRIDHRPTYAFLSKSCSASSWARPSMRIRPTLSRYARSTSFSTCRTFCSTTRIV